MQRDCVSNKYTVDKRLVARKMQQTMEAELTRLQNDVHEMRQKLVDSENRLTTVEHKYDELKRKHADYKLKHK